MTPYLLCVGGEDHVLRIPFLKGLRERGFQVAAAGTGDPAPFLRAGISFHQYYFHRFSARPSDGSAIGALASLVRTTRPDLVQTFDTKPNLLVPLAVRGAVPVVRTINGMGWAFSSHSVPALLARPIYCGLQRLAACWTAATVFQNRDDTLYFHRRHLLGKSLSCIIEGSGIDVAAFEKARIGAPSVATLRREFGYDESTEVVLTVSRLTRQKGVQTLLAAAAIVHAARPRARFLLVGPRDNEGPFAVSQAQLDRHAAYVTAPGPRPDIPTLLGIADVFAFPTEYREGIPRVLMEAGLAGLPIVTTRMPGCADVVTDRWNGYLVPPRDPRALAARILDLLQDRAAAVAMGARSAGLVRRTFDLPSILAKYDDLYRHLISERRAHADAARPAARANPLHSIDGGTQ